MRRHVQNCGSITELTLRPLASCATIVVNRAAIHVDGATAQDVGSLTDLPVRKRRLESSNAADTPNSLSEHGVLHSLLGGTCFAPSVWSPKGFDAPRLTLAQTRSSHRGICLRLLDSARADGVPDAPHGMRTRKLTSRVTAYTRARSPACIVAARRRRQHDVLSTARRGLDSSRLLRRPGLQHEHVRQPVVDRGGLGATVDHTITNLTSSSTYPLVAGTSVTWTATASNNLGPVEYRFYLYKKTAWVMVQDYGPSNTYTWTPKTTDAGTPYFLQVWVRAVGSTASYEAWRGTYSFDVVPAPLTLDSQRRLPDAARQPDHLDGDARISAALPPWNTSSR